MKHRIPFKQMFCRFTYPRLLYAVKRSNPCMGTKGQSIFSEDSLYMLHYTIKMFDLMYTPDLLGWVKMSDVESVHI